jgi:hypothetical protein
VGNATFYRYRLVYRGEAPLEQAYVGFYVDVDLGYGFDDYVGSDTTLGMGFVYNADDNDEGNYGAVPQALGVSFLQGPPALPDDGLDNDRDGEVDEPGERLGMTAFVYFNNGGGVQGNPSDAEDFYNYMQARWRDGLHITVGGNGRDFSTTPTNFIFPGDPVTGAFWSEISESYGIPTADRRFLISTGPFRMTPGETQDVTLAIAWSRGEDHLDSITRLRRDMAHLQENFDHLRTPQRVETTRPYEPLPLGFSENHPNPFHVTTTIAYSVPAPVPVRLVVYDVLGREVATLVDRPHEPGRYTVDFEAAALPAGLYLYRLQIGRASATRTMVKSR